MIRMHAKVLAVGLVIGLALIGARVWIGSILAQTATNPAPSAAACAYNSSPPTGTAGTFIIVQCDSSGKLKVH